MRGKKGDATIVPKKTGPANGGIAMTHGTFRKVPRMVGLIVATAVAMVLLAAAPAFADTTPADGQYGAVKGEQAGGGSGSLPFTGMNLLVLVAAGGAIAAGGVGLRAVAQRAPRN
jgi:hypothetical protein